MNAVVSLFSGIGGFDLGFAEAGFESSVVAEKVAVPVAAWIAKRLKAQL